MPSNELYLAVLPLIHLGQNFGLTEETLTLFPDRNFATQFPEEEVDKYIATFTNRTKYLTGGRVGGYDVDKIPIGNGLVIVRVVQHVD